MVGATNRSMATAAGLEEDDRLRAWRSPRPVLTSPPYPGVHVLYHRWQVDGRKEAPGPFWIAGKLDGAGSSKSPRKSPKGVSTPGQIVVAERQVPITLSGDLEDGIGNARLNRGAAVVTHAMEPMSGLEERNVDCRRVLVDA